MKLSIALILLLSLFVLSAHCASNNPEDKCEEENKGTEHDVKSIVNAHEIHHAAIATEEYVVLFHHQYAKAGMISNKNMVLRILSGIASSTIIHEYQFGPTWGFHGKLTHDQAEALRAQSSVRTVVKNVKYRVNPIFSNANESVHEESVEGQATLSEANLLPAAEKKGVAEPPHAAQAKECVVVHPKAPIWGLARISGDSPHLTNTRTLLSSGTGVDAYVVDSGVRVEHHEFGGRARWGNDFTSDYPGDNDNSFQDMNGHGTHVAGTIGGKTFGVANNVSIIAVRVLNSDGEGSTTGILQGLQFVYEQAQKSKKPSIVNLSLGGDEPDEALNIGVDHLIDSGVYVCIAAGNDAVQSGHPGYGSPADDQLAIIVGATDKRDLLSDFSNWGSMLTVLAPGTDIKSAWCTSNSATQTISGTSMATPHVVGVVSLYLGNALLENKSLPTPAAMRAQLVADAQKNVIHFHSVPSDKDALKQRTTPNNFLSIVKLLASYAAC